MPFSLGTSELLVLSIVAISVIALGLLDQRRFRIGVPLLMCAVLAAATTPADLFSMFVLSFAFVAVFVSGTLYRRSPA